MELLTAKHLSKHYDRPAVDGVSLSLSKGEIFCLLGPSGCGKSTLLRLIAGLEMPDTGTLLLDGRDITTMAPHRRNFGLMFQEFALFPHKSVFANVAFGLEMQNEPKAVVSERVMAMLDLVGMAGEAERNVADLSGGERQRVALARSLAPRPRLLMLDEPLGALDRALRERLLVEIRDILKNLATTAVFVTHDQSEALAVGDRVAVMHAGRLVQVDPPETVYRYPSCEFVARFLGFDNLLAGEATDDGGIVTALGRFRPARVPNPLEAGDPVTLVLRPEGARLTSGPGHHTDGPQVDGQVVSRIFTGRHYRTTVDLDQAISLIVDLPGEPPPPSPGDRIAMTLLSSAAAVIPATDDHAREP